MECKQFPEFPTVVAIEVKMITRFETRGTKDARRGCLQSPGDDPVFCWHTVKHCNPSTEAVFWYSSFVPNQFPPGYSGRMVFKKVIDSSYFVPCPFFSLDFSIIIVISISKSESSHKGLNLDLNI